MIYTVLTLAAVWAQFYCSADVLLPPSQLLQQWLNPVTLNLSWTWHMPAWHSQLEKCNIHYGVNYIDDRGKNRTMYILDRNLTHKCPGTNTMYINATTTCSSWTNSTRVAVDVSSQKTRAELVRDFACVVEAKGMNCSWIPIDPLLDITLSYWNCDCDRPVGCISLNKSKRQYTIGQRHGFYANVVYSDESGRFVVDSEKGAHIVKPFFFLSSPKLKIAEEGEQLNLTWTATEVGPSCQWIHELCNTQCKESLQCQNFTRRQLTHKIPYDDNCIYNFRIRVMNGEDCPELGSDWSEYVSYGTNKPPDRTLTVIAIIVPIILFVCGILSCYCFRRHIDIICPNVPDPSSIFKEMMLSGIQEQETKTERLYTPVPEVIDVNVAIIKDDGVLPENS